MNIKRGMRRITLLCGIAGAIVGGFVSYDKWQDTSFQRWEYNTFEQLVNSAVMQRQGAHCRDFLPSQPNLAFSRAVSIPWTSGTSSPDTGKPDLDFSKAVDVPGTSGVTAASKSPEEPDQPAISTAPAFHVGDAIPDGFIVGNDSIEVKGFAVRGYSCANGRIVSIDTESGTIDSTTMLSVRFYLLLALYPILGFFIPWAANRVLEWVCAGFVEHAK